MRSHGPTQSDAKPHASVAVPALVVGDRVRLTVLRADQTAGAIVRLIETEGKQIASTPSGGYSCVTPSDESSRMSVPLTTFGHLLVRGQGAARAQGQLTLVNGSGARSELAFTQHPGRFEAAGHSSGGSSLPRRSGLTEGRPARRSSRHPGERMPAWAGPCLARRPTPTSLTIGAASPGRFRLALSRDGKTVAGRPNR